MSADTDMVKYLVTASPADFVIEVPASWKITFGAVNPGAGAVGPRDMHCLRVYEGTKLRGVFCDVRGIRDLGIPFARKVERQTGSSEWAHDSDGGFSRSTQRTVDTSFRLEPSEVSLNGHDDDDEPEF